MGETLYGVKWRNFKMMLYLQHTLAAPSLKLMTPHLINLIVDPKERKPYDYPYLHTWVVAHTGKILKEICCERGAGAANPSRRTAQLRSEKKIVGGEEAFRDDNGWCKLRT